MAKANERTEREFALDVNAAVANTEDEIFSDAMGDEPLENDGDTSLEEMGEGLEGDDLEEGDEAEETEAEPEGDGDEATEEEAEAAEGEEATPETPRDQQGRFEDRRGAVPSGVLREANEKRRAAEEREAAKDRQLAEMRGRLDELSIRVNAPPKPAAVQTKTEKPDMFAEPEKYEQWLQEQADKRAEAKINERFGAFEQRQQQERETRLNENLSLAANGERGFEFQAAYRAVTSLDPKVPQNRALVQRLINSPDQGKAFLDWFEDNGAEEFRESIAQQLGLVPGRRAPAQNGQRQQPRQQSQTPRHEVRLPPSLNTARGGQRQQVQDPEMMDDTDNSVFAFATRR